MYLSIAHLCLDHAIEIIRQRRKDDNDKYSVSHPPRVLFQNGGRRLPKQSTNFFI